MKNFVRRAGSMCGALLLVAWVACSSKSTNTGGGDGGIKGGLTTGGFTTGVGAGSSTTTGAPTTTTGSTGAGGSGGTSTNCLRACAAIDALHCPADQPGSCATNICAATICRSQIDALAVCILRASLACDADGQANTNDCDAEATALDDCGTAGGP